MEIKELDHGSKGNEAVVAFLKYYTDPSQSLDYAVLIKGSWGSGKTYLVNQFLKLREKENKKHLYVSLYGMTSFSQIEEDFYSQLHPILSSKSAKIAGSVLKGLMKTAIKLDLDGDGKDEATISSQIPDIPLKDFFSTPAETLLVFDDLERCSMNITDVLGYINYFVEHSGFKVIILANEDRILQRETVAGKVGDAYRDIKEKLIGQTLLVKPQLNEAFVDFLETIPNDRNKKFLSENTDDVKNVFLQSNTNNLRVLKRSLWNFTRVLDALRETYWDHPEGITSIMKTLVALSLEIKTGSLVAEQLNSLAKDRYSGIFKRDGEPDTPAEILARKYNDVVFGGALPPDIIEDIVCNGIVDREAIWRTLDRIPPFADKDAEPAWIAAWRGYSRSDDEFEASVLKVEQEFRDHSYEELGDIVHVFGLRLRFAKIGAIKQGLDEVVSECITYIDYLLKNKKLGNRVPTSVDDFNGWQGLGVSHGDTEEFKEIFDHLIQATQQQIIDCYPEYAQRALKVAAEEPHEFFRLICYNNVKPSPYAGIPIFTGSQPEEFVTVLLQSRPEAQAEIMLAMKSRYEQGMLQNKLRDEAPWIARVIELLNAKLPELRVITRERIGQANKGIEALVRDQMEVSNERADS